MDVQSAKNSKDLNERTSFLTPQTLYEPLLSFLQDTGPSESNLALPSQLPNTESSADSSSADAYRVSAESLPSQCRVVQGGLPGTAESVQGGLPSTGGPYRVL